mmetsp:Transcript_3812/g.10000  ORF Transcript_3812/g.10000 Transcript_3812/m.10000 type:complete len:404 (-) Transcript_3812:1237-2448(-)|eukprot:CAMPEP_0197195180 /NCGR_PEP_ID=MMETSP1423-20130617/30602_1 /TAXON_ID=476441 /ORGANISM="Pseudo-nitzschia heimii, Strain UNC1101" /LENGTH=403 /DNA_ID=CAMNT_0042648749 /DNA_START=71 /DNA_END=1282 /DNA_ORIENTATION=-
MTSVRKILSAWITQPCTFIILTALFQPQNPATTVASAFTTTFPSVKRVHFRFRYASRRRHETQLEISRTQLEGHDRQIKIRDWRSRNNEPNKIYQFLQLREREQRRKKWNFFDPEGSLDLDVVNEWALEESYSKENGGCFLVATEGENSESDNDGNFEIVGTLGMISGSQISYTSSGSSVSNSEITAAIRRVCALRVDEDYTVSETSTTKILKHLILRGEQRALQSGATKMIGLAYSEVPANENNGYFDTMEKIAKPTASLLDSLGYRVSEQQIQGTATIQYEKQLNENEVVTETTPSAIEEGIWIIPATLAALVSLGVLMFNLYSNVFGIEQLWGSVDNGGIGTPLSTENVQELIRSEKLGRSSFDDSIGSTVRQWEDLSQEELREELALMKVMQGQPIRSK